MLTMLVLTSLAGAGDRLHVRDLDPTEVPARLEVDAQGRSWVDGERIRGSRVRQLEYLAAVVGPEQADTLRLDQRRAALRRMRASRWVGVAGSTGLLVALVVAPPLAVPAGVGALAVQGGATAVQLEAMTVYAPRALSEGVDQVTVGGAH